MPQLAKQHRHELLPASEAARVPLRLVLPYPGFELQPREPLQNLTEYAAYSFHGRASCCPLFRFSLNPIQRYQNPCLSTAPDRGCYLQFASHFTNLICTGVVSDRSVKFRNRSRVCRRDSFWNTPWPFLFARGSYFGPRRVRIRDN